MHLVAISVWPFQPFLERLWKCNSTLPLLSHQSSMSTLFISFFLYQANAWKDNTLSRSLKIRTEDIFLAATIHNLWVRTFGEIWWEINVNCELLFMQHVQGHTRQSVYLQGNGSDFFLEYKSRTIHFSISQKHSYFFQWYNPLQCTVDRYNKAYLAFFS